MLKRSFQNEETSTSKKAKVNDDLGISTLFTNDGNPLKYYVSPKNQTNITQKVIKYLMGNNENLTSKEEAIEALFKRDHPIFLEILQGTKKYWDLGCYCLPPVFFTKMTDVVSVKEYPNKLNNDKEKNLKNYIKTGEYYGDIAERKVFNQLKRYLESKGDVCLLLHGHQFMHKGSTREKDFIIVNLTHGYIMGLEVKSEKGLNKAKEQLKDSKQRIQAVLNSIGNMSKGWKFISVAYLNKQDQKSNETFLIYGQDNFEQKMQGIENELYKIQKNWIPQKHVREFVNISKTLLYEAQGHTEPLVSNPSIVSKISLVVMIKIRCGTKTSRS